MSRLEAGLRAANDLGVAFTDPIGEHIRPASEWQTGYLDDLL